MPEKFELDDIVLIGRNFEEYYKMFQLGEISEDEKILDGASGVSSFCAEANFKGYDVTAADRIYNFSPSELEKKCAQDLETVFEELKDAKDHYKWENFKDMHVYRKTRKNTYERFITDFKEKRQCRYVKAEFPKTQFNERQFTISIVSHFLFLYDEHLDYEFHKKTILELIRITSKEIRIFPIHNLRWEESSFVNDLMEAPEFADHKMKIEKVDYEFAKNANEMLKIEIESD